MLMTAGKEVAQTRQPTANKKSQYAWGHYLTVFRGLTRAVSCYILSSMSAEVWMLLYGLQLQLQCNMIIQLHSAFRLHGGGCADHLLSMHGRSRVSTYEESSYSSSLPCFLVVAEIRLNLLLCKIRVLLKLARDM